MAEAYGFWVDIGGMSFSEKASWIHAAPFGSFHHPSYGPIDLTPAVIEQFSSNVNDRVRGQDLDINYDHKTGEAAGWVRQAEVRSDGLYLLVEWTKRAAEQIRTRAYRYFSPEFVRKWTHPSTGVEHENVLFGGAVTNRPFLKGILPLNLAEVVDHEPPQEENKVDRDELIRKLGLSEDASDEDILGEITRLQEEPEAPEEPEPEGDPEEVVVPQAFAEQFPDVAAMFAAQQETIAKLSETVASQQVTNAQQAAVIKLTEWQKKGKFGVPPKLQKDVIALMTGMSDDPSAAVVKLMESLTTEGLVPLGEEAAGRKGTERSGDDSDRFETAIQKYMEDHEGVDYADAYIAVCSMHEDLAESVRLHEIESNVRSI